jgi:signal transduction histidine kinase
VIKAHSRQNFRGVFSAFSQEDVLTSGNGLGLNIIRRVVSSLGGDIQIYSSLTDTVTFDRVTLPSSSKLNGMAFKET